MKRPTLELYSRKHNKIDALAGLSHARTGLEKTPVRTCARRRQLHRNNKAFQAVKDATVPIRRVISISEWGFSVVLRGLIYGCAQVPQSQPLCRYEAPAAIRANIPVY